MTGFDVDVTSPGWGVIPDPGGQAARPLAHPCLVPHAPRSTALSTTTSFAATADASASKWTTTRPSRGSESAFGGWHRSTTEPQDTVIQSDDRERRNARERCHPPRPEPCEDLQPVTLRLDDAIRMCLAGEIKDAKTVTALLLWERIKARVGQSFKPAYKLLRGMDRKHGTASKEVGQAVPDKHSRHRAQPALPTSFSHY